MIKKIIRFLLFVLVATMSLISYSQEIDESILLQRFKRFNEYDSLLKAKNVDSTAITKKQFDIIAIDNKILSNYIVSKDLEGNKSRINLLINEVNKLNDLLYTKSERLLLFYMVAAFFILAFATFLILYIRISKRYDKDKIEFEKYRDEMEEQKDDFENNEIQEDNYVDEFQSAISDYKKELRKASEFIVSLRTDKINAENECIEQKEHINNLQKKHDMLLKKMQEKQKEDNSLYQQLSQDKQIAEEKYNALYSEYKTVLKKLESQEKYFSTSIESLTKQKDDSEAVRKELLEWIEVKNADMKRIIEEKRDYEHQLLSLRKEIISFLNNQSGQGMLSKNITNDIDSSSLVAELQSKIKNHENNIAEIKQQMQEISDNNNYLNQKYHNVQQLLKEKEELLQNNKKLLQQEYEKRMQIEKDLSVILSKFK